MVLLGSVISSAFTLHSTSRSSGANSRPVATKRRWISKKTRTTAQQFSLPVTTTTPVIEYDDFLPQPGPHVECALDVVQACMDTLLCNRDAGLEVCFNFASDSCRAALGGSLDEFNHYARNPVFGYLVNCAAYEIVCVGPEIPGTPTRGTMQTVLMDAKLPTPPPVHGGSGSGEVVLIPSRGESRRFLWTLLKERRPPRQGFWTIHEVIYTKNAFDMTM